MAMMIAVSSVSCSSVYAGGDKHKNNDKAKVECNDVGIALATLSLAYANLDEQGKGNVDDSLEEGEIAPNVDAIRDNLQSVLHTVEYKCGNVDFLGFVDFNSEDFVVD
jgi:hypothetical protein